MIYFNLNIIRREVFEMRRKLFMLVLAATMVLGVPASSFAHESGDLLRDRDRLQDKTCTSDVAILIEKDRVQTQDKDRLRILDC